MADMSVEDIISSLRARLGAPTDADLARKLRLSRNTIASWKSRGSVPKRILEILHGDPPQMMAVPPTRWAEHEREAFALALFRFCRLYGDAAKSGNYREILDLFPQYAPAFWLMLGSAQSDLMDATEVSEQPLSIVRTLLIHDDISDPVGSKKRDWERLKEVFLMEPDDLTRLPKLD